MAVGNWIPQQICLLLLVVGGKEDSDHLSADAIDLDFTTESCRGKAQRHLCDRFMKSGPGNRIELSVGLGSGNIHVSFQSPKGFRYWYYLPFQNKDRHLLGGCW